MQLTEIKRGKDGAEKFHLYVDGRYLLTIHEQVYLESRLQVGQMITGAQLDDLQQRSEFIWAKSAALEQLSRRSMTAKQLCEKLLERFSAEAAEKAVQRMTELGYLNDGEYAGRLARDLSGLRRYGPERVRRELLARGVEREIVEETLEQLECDPQQAVLELLEGKLSRLALEAAEDDSPKTRSRLFGRLARMGYGFEDIREAWRTYLEQA